MQSILGEFNKEQEAFIKRKESKTGSEAVPPWSGCPNEAALKEQCLALSAVSILTKRCYLVSDCTPIRFFPLQDKRNFVRSPPAGADFKFDFELSYPIAMATLAEDPNLEAMRFELVPRV